MYKFLIQIFEIDFEIFVCLCSRSKIATTVWGLAKVAIYTTNVDTKSVTRHYAKRLLNETYGSFITQI